MKQFEFDTCFVKMIQAYTLPQTHTNAHRTELWSCLSVLLPLLLFSGYPRPSAQEVFLLPLATHPSDIGLNITSQR